MLLEVKEDAMGLNMTYTNLAEADRRETILVSFQYPIGGTPNILPGLLLSSIPGNEDKLAKWE